MFAKDLKISLGFTLIELMVVISITAILSALGIAGYMEFNRRQILTQASRMIRQDLRLAQSLAFNNQKPSDCGTLDDYTFKLVNKTYKIFADCSNPDYSYVDSPTKEVTLPEILSLNGFTQVKFKVLSSGVILTGGPQLTIVGWGLLKTITVGEGGEINLQ